MAYRLNITHKDKGDYLTIENKYWDKAAKKPKSAHYKTLGYVHNLTDEFSDPIAHFTEEVKKLNDSIKADNKRNIDIDLNEQLPEKTNSRYNFGYAVIMKIYHALELDRFFNNKARHENFEYNTNSIMKLLTITRILKPSSKKAAYEYKDRFFERFDFARHDVYRSLSYFSKICTECQQFISDQIFEKFGRNTQIVYFDVTNFHFEIDVPDDLRKRGKEKNNRPDPIVQMAMAMDADSIPLYYKILPGNTHDSKTFIPVFKEVCVRFTPQRVIAVADMGCTSSDNIYFLKGGDRDKRVNGYVFSYSIRKSSEEFKKYVLNESAYTDNYGAPLKEGYTFKVKSRLESREIEVSMKDGSKKSMFVNEKQVVYWSYQYAQKAKMERAEAVKKAQDIINNPKKYNKKSIHGVGSYVKNVAFDKKTGEILDKPGKKLELNADKIKEDEKYDGYYCLITSELELSAERVIEIYRGLSQIEDCFRVEKSNLEIRPVFVSRADRINAHVLTCFISLVMLRLIQKLTDYKYTPEQIISCLNKISCSQEHDNIYLFDYREPIADDIGRAFGIDFTKKRLELKEIKNILALSKKGNLC